MSLVGRDPGRDPMRWRTTKNTGASLKGDTRRNTNAVPGERFVANERQPSAP
jgi:hypothetical protein